MDYIIKEKHVLIAKVLLDKLNDKGNENITYGKLSELVDRIEIPINMGKPLGVLSNICKDLDLPLISTIVYGVKSKEKIPSDGYFEEFFPSVNLNDYSLKKKTYQKELDKLLKWKDWSSLKNYLGIQD